VNALPLADWDSFYVIVGSSAAGLTGLMFVVVALIADRVRPDPSMPTRGESVSAFGSPTVVHFCFALLVAAILSAPWRTLGPVAVAIGACGVAGLGYLAIVFQRARRQTAYRPVLEDWLWHTLFPFVSYVALIVTAAMLSSDPHAALFVSGAATLLLLFIGIHNAWDTVLYIAFDPGQDGSRSEAREEASVSSAHD
jgi:hypothetical protein